MKHIVFVYGTLRKGFYNHRLLENATFSDTGSAYGVRLYDVGPFPAVLPTSDGKGAVHGELYEVDDETLTRLDRLEGVPHLFRRELVWCDYDHESDYEELYAWVYLWNGDPDRLTPIPCGDYQEFKDAITTL